MMSVHAAMSFSRSRFQNSSNSVGEGSDKARHAGGKAVAGQEQAAAMKAGVVPRPNADVSAADAIEGRAEMPGWQNAFVLGPNVRFTRTPESAFSRRMPVETPHLAEEEAPADILSEAAEPEMVVQPEAAVQEPAIATVVKSPEPRIQPPRMPFLPQPPDARGARALTYKLRLELARKQAEEAAAAALMPPQPVDAAAVFEAPVPGTDSPVQPLPAASVASVEQVVTPQASIPAFAAHLPDELFWEVMTLDLPDDAGEGLPASARTVLANPLLTAPAIAPTLASASPAAPAIRLSAVPPVIRIPGGSAIRLYREIGVHHPAIPAPTQVVEPEVAPQPVVETVAVAEPQRPVEQVQLAERVVAEPRFTPRAPIQASQPMFREAPVFADGEYEYPSIDLLQQARVQQTTTMTPEALEQSAGLLESVLEDFGIKGEIIDVRPGPVVTLYEFEPAPGVKSSRVIGLSDDIARSMSALSARVAVVPGRNVIGIELPNPVRETVYLRELIEATDYSETRQKLALCLGKTIGGEPVIAELAKMPHLLVAGTTGSGKSVAINTMILSLLYRLKPEECRLIMVDPKMLELSVYDGIPHLLTPVVTDPKKAVMALKWAVREMEDRYRKMSRLGVRNIDGYNARAAAARAKGETVFCNVQTGFDRATGEAVYEQEEMDLTAMPYIVVIVDEMADLMMVAGKEIEGAIQRLAQMARAAGIHLIMATQRPSVDVITGTIKANFPTRISFQVTSKIDSRTILGEQGAEHLLGQGDMLHMMGGGRISRVHGPFVSDEEVEKVVAHLKTQGRPEYLGTVTEDADEADDEAEEETAVFDKTSMGDDDSDDLYEKAVKVVMRDKKCSTSYIQRRLSIGYNRAASLVERMEQEGIVGPANHVGKRAIIAGERDTYEAIGGDD
ncbi:MULTISPECIES: DNA translocase FtsK [Rhizobium/Agrobacterium group]|uniref:DNA translocase FtsK n=1 Tax=Rhizobium/Agrobacterium group TaxID=227290 RepID=UPI0003F20462|nr:MULTISPECIES: DNA translocase FtsK [Rhizobium/Agrobacterium group]AHK03040.1 cell division protein FtsK [Agrobacterium tumefaciens LBA4213 (Ach5)]NIB55768.1 DNA translocase FtsK [Agrobacterium tumefaciens]NSZ23305.1 DNA translocase FtsK [Agrobacterium tumefaciens]NTA43722.1 DNA translocase FtsK [Agrobacterium tumefaciens]NTB19390.1 DNA translocase FtsK [Agrobacterium tumefaciens]